MAQSGRNSHRTITVALGKPIDEWLTTPPYTYHIAGYELDGTFHLGFRSKDATPAHQDVIPDHAHQSITRRLKPNSISRSYKHTCRTTVPQQLADVRSPNAVMWHWKPRSNLPTHSSRLEIEGCGEPALSQTRGTHFAPIRDDYIGNHNLRCRS